MASEKAASPHAPAKRQMEPLNSGSRGGMPLVAAPQQPGACRWWWPSTCANSRLRPPVAWAARCKVRTAHSRAAS